MSTIAYINGKVYTVNDTAPHAEAFLVDESKGTFIAVGTTDEILSQNPSKTVDLKGQFVMPGLHDAHSHLMLGAFQKLHECSLGWTSGEKETIQKLKAHCSQDSCGVSGAWLIGNFYVQANFPDGKPDRKFLDAEFPDTPVMIREHSCHHVFLNTKGLEVAGYTDEDYKAKIHGGWFVENKEGELTGECVEAAAKKAYLAVPKSKPEVYEDAMEYACKMANRFGITSVQEASANPVVLNALTTLEKKGKLTINVNAHIVCAPVNFAMETEENLLDLLERAGDFESEHVIAKRVKFWLDGAPLPPHYTHATLLPDGEIDLSKILIPWDEFLGHLERYDSKGYSCKIHVAGDGSAKYALDAIEQLRKRRPNGPRHELAHCNDVHPNDVKRFAPLRVTAELSPCIWHRTEPELTVKELVFPFKSFYESGATVSIGTDWFLPETPNLFAGISGIVSRPGENLPLETVLRIVTKEAAEAAGVKNTGVIEGGKRANFIVLDRNILEAEEIKSTRVKKTYFEGKMVYDYDDDEDKDAFDIYM